MFNAPLVCLRGLPAAERRAALPPCTGKESVLPRYFFDVIDGFSLIDGEGTELPDLAAARRQAIQASGEILRDMAAKFWLGTPWRMTVRDEDRRPLFVIRFSAEEVPAGDQSPA